LCQAVRTPKVEVMAQLRVDLGLDVTDRSRLGAIRDDAGRQNLRACGNRYRLEWLALFLLVD